MLVFFMVNMYNVESATLDVIHWKMVNKDNSQKSTGNIGSNGVLGPTWAGVCKFMSRGGGCIYPYINRCCL